VAFFFAGSRRRHGFVDGRFARVLRGAAVVFGGWEWLLVRIPPVAFFFAGSRRRRGLVDGRFARVLRGAVAVFGCFVGGCWFESRWGPFFGRFASLS
jgi:hypothetical protein